MTVLSPAEPPTLPDLRELLPDDDRLNLLEILEFRNAAHIESVADSANTIAENSGAFDDVATALNRIADAAERFNKLFASLIGEGLAHAANGSLKGVKYLRSGDGDEFFR